MITCIIQAYLYRIAVAAINRFHSKMKCNATGHSLQARMKDVSLLRVARCFLLLLLLFYAE